jgi:hypothetical protein
MTSLEAIIQQIKEISLDHTAWKVWRKKHKKQYDAWANAKYKCTYCGKKGIPNKRKARHEKSKKCKRSRGITAPRKKHKTRSDKGKAR